MYKTNRLNHDFQIAYFLAGGCHTADAAWSQMCDLEDDRQLAINVATAEGLRIKARLMRAKERLESATEKADQLEAQADIFAIESQYELDQRNYDAAVAELATIRLVKEKLEPFRKFKHLNAVQAHQAAQQEEWKQHLLYTAQNMLMSQGSIAHDYLGTMRQHPEFKQEMLPLLDKWRGEILATVHRGLPSAQLSFISEPKYNTAQLLASGGVELLPNYSEEK